MVIELPQKMMATSMASLTIKSENPPPPDLGAAEVSLTPSALPEYLARIGRSEAECVVYHDGYRVWTYSYADMARLAGALGARLRAGGVHKGETVMIWSENRPGWVAALWGCLLEGIVVVPVDQQSSIDLFERLRRKVQPRALLLGNHVPEVPDDGRTLILRLADRERDGREAPQGTSASLGSEDIAEIVFTSGTTAEPKGAIGLLCARRHHDDRDVGARPELAADVEPVAAGQHQVEQHDVGADAQHGGHDLVAAADHVDLDAMAVQVLGGQPGEPLVVLDVHHADLGLGGHTESISPAGPATSARNIPKHAGAAPARAGPAARSRSISSRNLLP